MTETDFEQITRIEDDDDDDDDDYDDSKKKSTPVVSSSCPVEENNISVLSATMILTSFSTCGAAITMPYSLGQLGYILGPVLMFVLYGSGIWYMNFIIDAVDRNDAQGDEDRSVVENGNSNDDDEDGIPNTSKMSLRTISEVGYMIAGRKGNNLFSFFQLANFVCFMPVALDLVQGSTKFLFFPDGGGCTGYFTIGTWLCLFILVQVIKDMAHASYISYLTVLLTAIVSFILLPYSFITTDYDQTPGYTNSIDQAPPMAFGNPQPTWDGYAQALANFTFGFAPIMIIFEVRDDIRRNKSHDNIGNESKKKVSQAKQVLYISVILQILLYLVPAYVCVFRWGYNIENPVTVQLSPKSWISYFINVYIIFSSVLDFLIAVMIFTKWMKNKVLPKKRPWQESPDDNNSSSTMVQNVISQILCTLPHTFYSMVAVLVIPNFSALVGIVSGLTLVGAHTWGIALLLEWNKYEVVSSVSKLLRTTVCSFGLVCFLYTIWIIAATVYSIIGEDFSSKNFFCSVSF